MSEFKKAETPEEFKKQLSKFMRLQFADEWETFYCDEVCDIVMCYTAARGIKIFGKEIKIKEGRNYYG